MAFVQNYFMPLTKIRCKVINKLKLVEINGNSINNTDKRIKTEYVITFQTINGNKIRESISKNKYMNTNIGEYGFIKYKGVHYKGFVKVGVQ